VLNHFFEKGDEITERIQHEKSGEPL
jgi:hypothetical protein